MAGEGEPDGSAGPAVASPAPPAPMAFGAGSSAEISGASSVRTSVLLEPASVSCFFFSESFVLRLYFLGT